MSIFYPSKRLLLSRSRKLCSAMVTLPSGGPTNPFFYLLLRKENYLLLTTTISNYCLTIFYLKLKAALI